MYSDICTHTLDTLVRTHPYKHIRSTEIPRPRLEPAPSNKNLQCDCPQTLYFAWWLMAEFFQ